MEEIDQNAINENHSTNSFKKDEDVAFDQKNDTFKKIQVKERKINVKEVFELEKEIMEETIPSDENVIEVVLSA